MQFTQMHQLQSFKTDMLQLSAHRTNSSQEILIQAKHTPAQYYTMLNQVQQINHSRSMATSLMQQLLSEENTIRVFKPFGTNQQQQKQYDNTSEKGDDDVIVDYTPSMLKTNSSRKSNIFTSSSLHIVNQQVNLTQSNTLNNNSNNNIINEGIKIYYFGQPVHKHIQYSSKATIDTIIHKSLAAYMEDLSLDQTFITTNDYRKYQLRFVEEDGSFIPDYTVDAVGRDRVIADSIFEVLVLVLKDKQLKGENQKQKSKLNSYFDSAEIQSSGHLKLNIFNEANMHVSTIILSRDDTLEKGVDFLQAELKQKIVLFENLTDQYPLPADFDVRNLSTYKLYVKKKKFQDEPDKQANLIKVISSVPKDLSTKILPPIGITQASRYEQYEVVKINSRGTEQTRILGIDQTKIYNYDPIVRRKTKQASFFSIFIGNNANTGTKKPERLIADILAINSLEGKNFEIILPEKKTVFIAPTEQKKQKILRKLKFLIEFNRHSTIKL